MQGIPKARSSYDRQPAYLVNIVEFHVRLGRRGQSYRLPGAPMCRARMPFVFVFMLRMGPAIGPNLVL